jgi:HAMP domain-containing protein/HPt (histidine-containing phosphotransfer) domain-containing protein
MKLHFSKHSIFRRYMVWLLLIIVVLSGAVSGVMVVTLSRGMGDIITVEILIALGAAVLASIIFIWNVSRKISAPLQELTAAAEKISEGDLDVTIPTQLSNLDEITHMSEALNKMMERFRIHARMQAENHTMATTRLQYRLFVGEAVDVPQAYRMTMALLRHQFESLKIVAVYADPSPRYMIRYQKTATGEPDVVDSDSYPYHSETLGLLAERRAVFFNKFMLVEHEVGFTDEDTEIACIVAVAVEKKTSGYFILETKNRELLSVVKEETFLLSVADELAAWISTRKAEQKAERAAEATAAASRAAAIAAEAAARRRQVAIPVEHGEAIAALVGIEGLSVDAALETMGGLEDVYERAIRLFIRLAPEAAVKMDGYLCIGGQSPPNPVDDETDADAIKVADIKAFAIEIHGMKGSLNNIGAAGLAAKAAGLEDKAKSGDAAYCITEYPHFRELMLALRDKIEAALPVDADTQKPEGDKKALLDALDKAAEFAEAFDAFEAKGLMLKAAESTYGAEADALLEGIIAELEIFNCDSAVAVIEKLRALLI